MRRRLNLGRLTVAVRLDLGLQGKITRHWPIGLLLAATLVAAAALAPHTVTASAPDASDTKAAETHGDFYVAPNGKDTWSGKLATPRDDGTDGPFATLTRARDAVRTVRAAHGAQRAYTVIIRGGLYPLEQTLVFTPKDSAAEAAPTTYTAWPGEKPVLSGGRRITDWKKSPDGNLWTATIPQVRDGKWYSTQLFVNGRRCTRARIPNDGYLRSDGQPRFSQEALSKLAGKKLGTLGPITGVTVDKLGMSYKNADIQRWNNPEDVNLCVMQAWTSAMQWIADIDQQRHAVFYTGPIRFPASQFERQMPYFVENVREGLDSPGEWYLDRKTGVIIYWPREGEDMTSAETVVSAIQLLVRFDGAAAKGQFIDGLIFRGLSFQHADWGPLDRHMENDGYAGCHFLEAAVHGTGLRHSAFEKCEFTRCGGYALYLIDGSAFNRVQQCEIHDMGGGGVLIGVRSSNYDVFQQPLPPDDAPEALLSRHNIVDNCFFHDNGKVFFGAIGGVFVAHSPFNKVTHNEVCNMPYSGMTIGRRLDRKYSHAHHNEVAWNHIHHIGHGVMSDMGGIYTEGISPGTHIHHNLIHDVNYYRYGAWAIYLDGFSSEIQVDHNIAYNCMDGGLMQNHGTNNTIQNNIFVFNTAGGQINRGMLLMRTANMTVEHNIIGPSNGEVLGYRWSKDEIFHFDWNLYWKPKGKELSFKDWPLDEWRAMGEDRHSIIADPLFVDAERRDFRLKPGSPAEKIGFHAIDTHGIGLYGAPEWTSSPAKIPIQTLTKVTPPPPDTIDDDFELTPVGKQINKAATTGETSHTSIRVTDEMAAGGRQSLKFVDGPAENAIWPYIYYRLTTKARKTCLSFDVRMSKDAVLSHEWRRMVKANEKKPRNVTGPLIKFENDGEVIVGKKTVAHYPLNQWFHVEIVCPLGVEANGRFTLTVTVPGQPPQKTDQLRVPVGSDFNELNWLGWLGAGVKPATFYLDNLKLTFDQ